MPTGREKDILSELFAITLVNELYKIKTLDLK